jgi:threonine/homoserine/homoserine lactone efflux protein
MFELFQMFFLGFILGLTGALAPGPTLVATINASIAGDWTTGLKVSLGHVIVELFLVILILLGLATLALPYASAIAGIGGIALVAFGALTIAGSRKVTLNFSSPDSHKSLYRRICYQYSEPLFLDLVALNRERNDNCGTSGGTCAGRGPYDRALVC